MKIKGVIEDLKKRKKNLSDNSKNTSRNFSGAVVGSVGSVRFQIVPCSSLYLFSRSIVKVTQSCLTLSDPMNYTVHGILQVRMLGWVAFPFSRESSQPRSPELQVDSLRAESPGNVKKKKKKNR